MEDIREIIKRDRGLIKRFQAFLPGYKKYRNTEDLRTADAILRKELAAQLEKIERDIQDGRKHSASRMDMELLEPWGELLNLSHTVTEKVRHAEHGYAPWISGDVRVEEEELSELYDYDMALFHYLERLQGMSKQISEPVDGTGETQRMIKDLSDALREFEEVFDSRLSRVKKTART
ncbi:MAG TPA: hypothetical protein ENK47_01360 [Euryarchaeota archaeon]|nr:hypothetical protein [Euryarchaeota archaeon]